MGVVELADYKLNIVEKICMDKFENDIMLIFNNFTNESMNYITTLIKKDIKEIEGKGVLFDNKLIKICCTMYLGIAWSMYKKGKRIQKEKKIIQGLDISEYGNSVELVSNSIKTTNVMEILNDIVLRYFTLYLSRHTNDILDRMEIIYHPQIKDDKQFKKIFLENLRSFAMKVLSVGIIDECKII
ncbi:hypothetical protein [Sporosalibacterium faouarense]|uniref:hypothetical protein n=1 Tax=Sporosalibacterium faouarense TaxID=516123 RepID=UPI00141CBE42|nr:hypothetical protein [Sporosalibacterium faouarense]MTI49221.1 hypothetical protein [Bacillota bacterium]